jgi:hypothetical protein
MEQYGTKGGSFEELRPYRGVNDQFPVYKNLEELLLKPGRFEYDPTVAHVAAVLAGWAYADAEVVATAMVRMGLQKNRCRSIALKNDAMFILSQAYLVQSRCGRVVFLVYRGTEPTNLDSWLVDANVNPIVVPVGDGKVIVSADRSSADDRPRVHGGFYVNQRATWFDVEWGLKLASEGRSVLAGVPRSPNPNQLDQGNAQDDEEPIDKLQALYIVGHSLGGAMAAIAAFRLAYDDHPEVQALVQKVRGVYTFGQPMIGNEKWRDLLEKPRYDLLTRGLFRHVYGSDPVPSLPPFEAGAFVHTGVERRSNSGDASPGWELSSRPRGQMPIVDLALAFVGFAKKQLASASTREHALPALPAKPLQALLRPLSPDWRPAVAKWLGEIFALALAKARFAYFIYDHLPAGYIIESTPAGKLSEFGDF